VAADIAYKTISDAAVSVENEDVQVVISPLDIYQSENADTKNVTLRFTLIPATKTLSSADANIIVDTISAQVIAATKATII
jgi:phenylalanyl-tRNA synthetase beta subunit